MAVRPAFPRRAPAGRGRRWTWDRLRRLIPALVGIGLALLVIRWVDAGIRPVLNEMAQGEVHNAVTALVNDAVSRTLADEGVSYDSMVSIRTDQSGRSTAMSTDSARLNGLRTQILEAVLDGLEELNTGGLGIPLGNLTGFASASGLGPELPVQIVWLATPSVEFQNEFSTAGINQTLHRIVLEVSVPIRILVPGGTVDTQVDSQICAAETVIVGEVPDTFLDWQSAASQAP